MPLITVLLNTNALGIGGLTSSEIRVSSTFNPVGSGARALGVGGAFIAIADDATAASWNPGGLLQLRKPEIAVVGNYVHRNEDLTFAAVPAADTNENVYYDQLNYFSASIPCAASRCGKNMVFSVNYQAQYNFDKQSKQNYSFDVNTNIGSGFSTSTNRFFKYQQSGDLYALGLAYAIQVNEQLSLGVSVNFWGDYLQPNEWQHHYITNDIQTVTAQESGQVRGTFINNEIRIETNEFKGVNYNLGAFWNVYQKDEKKLVLGAVVKTPFTAKVKRTVDRTFTAQSSLFGIIHSPLETSRSLVINKEKYNMPLSYGFGASFQLSDAFTLAADFYRTQWDDFIRTDAEGKKTTGIGGIDKDDSTVKATNQYRFGVEYRIISQDFAENYIIPLRAGVFYDPIPTNGTPDSTYGISLGTGIAYKTYVFDIAYQYRFGNDLAATDFEEDGFSNDLREHTVYASVFYRF